jgi:hypothetical protein
MKPADLPNCNDILPTDTPETKAVLRFANMVALSNYYESAGCPRADSMRIGDVFRIPVRGPSYSFGSTNGSGGSLPPVCHEFELCEAQNTRGKVFRLWRKKPFA